MSSSKKTACVEFFCDINEYSIKHLLDTVKDLRQKGYQRIKIIISSVGGSVFHALSAYNELRGIDTEIVTHNFGSVDSSAGVIFCAGSTRYSVPHARFLIHPLSYGLKGNFSEEQLAEHMKSFQIDTENTAGVIAEATGKEENEILEDLKNRKHLNPEQAMDYGLVDEIKTELVEAGEPIFKIECKPPQQALPQQFRIG